jgi:dipeptide/tripeptide permease
MGLQFTTAMLLLYGFTVCTIPLLGAWLGDVKIGRYNTIMLGVVICGLSHIIQIFGAMPIIFQKHQGLGPFLASLLLLAIGAGKFKLQRRLS